MHFPMRAFSKRKKKGKGKNNKYIYIYKRHTQFYNFPVVKE